MEELKLEDLTGTPFLDLVFPENAEVNVENKTLYFTKWNWDYSEFLNFQKHAQQIIQKHRDHKIYIFCNHPHCFTLGRGNERGDNDLVEFDSSVKDQLKYPVHKIFRGGGITFHYPGQWIFYPIVAVNEKYSLEDHMCWVLNSIKTVLRDEFGLEKVMATKKLMGVWFERQKLASIGVGLNRFVTEHGLALNLIYDEDMFNEVKKTSPCGMNPETYISLEKIINTKSENLILDFHQAFLNQL